MDIRSLDHLPALTRRGRCYLVSLFTRDSMPIMTENDRAVKLDFELLADLDKLYNVDKTGINLAQSGIAAALTRALLENDGRMYDILYSCIMPSHIHLILDTGINLDPYNLSTVVRAIKGKTGREINTYLKKSGAFWQKPIYYLAINDDSELGKIGKFIIQNPVTAGLAQNWEDWPYSYVKYG